MSKWLLILSIFHRLYTSVIVLNPEKWVSKVSWPTDMSPTASFSPRDTEYGHPDYRCGVGGVYPGYGRTGWAGRAIPGTHQDHPPGPIFNIYLASGPTHGQMKAFSGIS